MIFGVTPDYQVVQDYRIAHGDPLTDPDHADRRLVAVVGPEVADKLFDDPALAIGKKIRIAGSEITIKGVTAKKGGCWGSRSTASRSSRSAPSSRCTDGGSPPSSVKMPTRAAPRGHGAGRRSEVVATAFAPGSPTTSLDKADALVAFWTSLTGVLFTIIPAVVCIGIVVGGIVIMNIMLMSVNERTRSASASRWAPASATSAAVPGGGGMLSMLGASWASWAARRWRC